jgi:RHH-type rel operon transcriptional repressor/antitoxin RelB
VIQKRANAPVQRATGNKEQSLRRKSEKSSQVIAVRVEPMIEQRLRLLAETTGQSQSFFLKQLIEDGIAAMEDLWLPKELAGQIRSGARHWTCSGIRFAWIC